MPPKKSKSASTSTSTITKEKQMITLLVVEKNGDIKETEMKRDAINQSELAKKCKFKKLEGFCKRAEWGYSIQGFKIFVEMWAKDDGLANQENKYEFPPPLDHDLYFGACILIAHDAKNNYVDLTESLWDKIYEHLFGGFESLVTTQNDDDDEEDELENIPDSKKTKHGYLKDGFVVDGGVNADDSDDDSDDDDSDDDDSDDDDSDDDDDDDDSDDESDDDDDDDDDDIDDDIEEDESDDDDESGNDSDVNKVKKNNASNSKHSNTILNTNTNTNKKIKHESRVSSNLNSKDKKKDIAISSIQRTGSILPNSKKINVVSALLLNSKSKNSNVIENDNYIVKNSKASKIEEEISNGYKSNDSSELSEEEYMYS